MHHWVPPEIVAQRVALAEEINKILSRTVNLLHQK
jgi:hypothetical protein